MATFFSLQNGNLSELSAFGYSIKNAENASNTTGVSVLTGSSYSSFVNIESPNYHYNNKFIETTIDGIALQLSSRNANPVGTLGVSVKKVSNESIVYDNSSKKYTTFYNPKVYQTAAMSPFTPNNWCVYFPTNSFLSIDTAANANFNLFDTAFTIEFWYNRSTDVSRNIVYTGDGYSDRSWAVQIDALTAPALQLNANATNIILPHNYFPIGVWTHVLISSVITTVPNRRVKIFINGTSRYDITRFFDIVNNKQFKITGESISNLRILRGTALSINDSSYAVPTNPLTNIANTLLLTCQNNNIKDFSNNNYTLTPNAGPPIVIPDGPFPKVYNPSLYGGSFSFPEGSFESIAFKDSNVGNLLTNPFTIEFWVYSKYPSSPTTFDQTVLSKYTGFPANGTGQWRISTRRGGNDGIFFEYNTNISTYTIISVNTPIADGRWHHIAVTRDSANTIRLYKDGIILSTTNNVTTNFNFWLWLSIGFSKCYLSNIRIIKGTALYGATNFTPSTSPLTNITNTEILLNATNVISSISPIINYTYPINLISQYDDSNNLLSSIPQSWQLFKFNNSLSSAHNEAISFALSSSTPNQLSLLATTTAVDDAHTHEVVYSGTKNIQLTSFKPYPNFEDSFYFEKTSWLMVPSRNRLIFDKDFTIEFWFNTKIFNVGSNNGFRRIFGIGPNNTNSLQLIIGSGTAANQNISLWNTASLIIGTSAVCDGFWHHIAISRYNNLLRLYVDGTQTGNPVINETTFDANINNPLSIGTYNNNSPFELSAAYINNFRIVNGTAVYNTSSFSVPTSPLTFIPNTVFLLKPGVDYNKMVLSKDNTHYKSSYVGPTPVIGNSPSGVNEYLMSFDGSASSYALFGVSLWIGYDEYTVEAWFKINNLPTSPSNYYIFDGRNFDTWWSLALYIDSSGKINFLNADTVVRISTNAININQWYHVAVCRRINNTNIATTTVYLNGNEIISFSEGTTISPVYIDGIRIGSGAGPAPSGPYSGFTPGVNILNGSIRNVYITRYAKYNSNFTPNSSIPVNDIYTLANIYYSTKLSNIVLETSNNYYTGISDDVDVHIGNSLTNLTSESYTITAINRFKLNNIYIHKGGTLTFPTNENAELTIFSRNSSGLIINPEGTFNIGTSSSNIPANITHTFYLSNNAMIDIHTGGNFNVYGANKIPYTYLQTNTTSGSRIFTTVNSVSTSWLTGDSLIFATISSSKGVGGTNTISAFNNDKTFSTTASSFYSYVSLSSMPYVPSVGNISRNIKISTCNSNQIFNIRAHKEAKVNINNAEFKIYNNTIERNGIIPCTNSNGYFILSNNVFDCDNRLFDLLNSPSFNFNKSYRYIGTNPNTFSHPTNFNFGDGDFTIEAYLYTERNNILDQTIFNTATPTANQGFKIYINNTSLRVDLYNFDNLTLNLNYEIDLKKWTHFAFTRKNNTFYIFKDGLLLYGGSLGNNSVRLSNSNNQIVIGNLFQGYINNVRIIKGDCLYTSNFSISPVPPTNITNTVLLTNIVDFEPVENVTYSNNIFTRTNPITIKGNCKNLNFTNNLIFNPFNVGLDFYLFNGENSTFSNNYVIGPVGFGTRASHSNLVKGIVNYNSSTTGFQYNNVSSGKINTIVSDIINVHNNRDGMCIDASSIYDANNNNLNTTIFQNITSINNSNIGFRISGNNLNPLNPLKLNINTLNLQNNISGNFEAYNISGNLSSITSNNRNANGITTSIGNGKTVFDNLSSIIVYSNVNIPYVSNVRILSGLNYNPVIFKTCRLSSYGESGNTSLFGNILLDSVEFNEFKLDDSVLSANYPLQLLTTRDLIQGSYLINNSYLGITPFGTGIRDKYQTSNYKSTGFAFTNFNKIPNYNITYMTNGERSVDSNISITNSDRPSERLTPYSLTDKIKSGSKFNALNSGDSCIIKVSIRKSTSLDGTAYNGNPPRLILKRNASAGIFDDIIISELTPFNDINGKFVQIKGPTPAVTSNCVLEFYVDCDGTAGWINIDNWEII